MNLHGDSAVASGQQRLSVKQSTSQRFNVEFIARICDHNTHKVRVLHQWFNVELIARICDHNTDTRYGSYVSGSM